MTTKMHLITLHPRGQDADVTIKAATLRNSTSFHHELAIRLANELEGLEPGAADAFWTLGQVQAEFDVTFENLDLVSE